MDRNRRETATASHGRCLWLGRQPHTRGAGTLSDTGAIVGAGGHCLSCQQPDVHSRDRHFEAPLGKPLQRLRLNPTRNKFTGLDGGHTLAGPASCGGVGPTTGLDPLWVHAEAKGLLKSKGLFQPRNHTHNFINLVKVLSTKWVIIFYCLHQRFCQYIYAPIGFLIPYSYVLYKCAYFCVRMYVRTFVRIILLPVYNCIIHTRYIHHCAYKMCLYVSSYVYTYKIHMNMYRSGHIPYCTYLNVL